MSRPTASWSRVWLTDPSMVFSIGTSAAGTSPSRTARKQSITVGKGISSSSPSAPSSSSSASSQNVPGGPR